MKLKQVAIWFSVMVVTIGIIWGLVYLINSSPSGSTASQNKPKAVSKTDIMLGNPSKAKATLIEYADFQCPACALTAPIARNLQRKFKDQLLMVFRFFPLVNTHQHAMASAQAAYAASRQGKFWEMYDLLFTNQQKWSTDNNAQKIFSDYAKQLKLDINTYNLDSTSEAGIKFITDEQNEGLSIGIDRTPSFFINGKFVENPLDETSFKQLIQDEINKK